MSNDADPFDDQFRSKLYDLEVDTQPDDWEAIAKRLPQPKLIYRRRPWMYAAATISLLLSVGAIYMYRRRAFHDMTDDRQIVYVAPENKDRIIREITAADEPLSPQALSNPLPQDAPDATAFIPSYRHKERKKEKKETTRNNDTYILQPIGINATSVPPPTLPKLPDLIAEVRTKNIPQSVHRTTQKKWRFGSGIGGLQLSSHNTVNNYLLRSSTMQDVSLAKLNAPIDMNKEAAPKTNMTHKIPLSFGFSVNRFISSKWSVSSGLSYTLLRSEWEPTATGYGYKTQQHLHFIGIPLNVIYRIMEYNKITLYASAGGMVEMNIAGHQETEKFLGGIKVNDPPIITHERMKELQLSVGAHAGISYPLFFPVSAFAELNASYYFDNRSRIETIYSQKPFYISPQFGLRISF
ncbi:MAG: PorT family protein [Tannerellaceae bacterium]|jgi:hypothetical protein|nr:PorT family protein [Tannerellaceae bacterium]